MKSQVLAANLGGRPGRPDCPSDLVLDRLHAGELPDDQVERTRAHAAGCDACAAHLRTLRFDAMPGARAAAMQARIERELQAAEAGALERLRRFLRSLVPERPLTPLLALSTVACAAALLVLVARPPAGRLGGGPAGDLDDGGGVREKGGPVLHLHRQVPGGSEEVQSGARLPAGARLRFVVDLPRAGLVSIVGVEASGALYTAWPTEKDAPPARLPAGPGQALPGAVVLDESTGRETLYLVSCPPDVGAPRCEAPASAAARPTCQRGCALSPFVIDKEPAR